jgi:hypothetical protein
MAHESATNVHVADTSTKSLVQYILYSNNVESIAMIVDHSPWDMQLTQSSAVRNVDRA